jgi:hypothetical protein
MPNDSQPSTLFNMAGPIGRKIKNLTTATAGEFEIFIAGYHVSSLMVIWPMLLVRTAIGFSISRSMIIARK